MESKFIFCVREKLKSNLSLNVHKILATLKIWRFMILDVNQQTIITGVVQNKKAAQA